MEQETISAPTTVAEVNAERAEMRIVGAGERREQPRENQQPEGTLPLGAGGRNAVKRAACSGERSIILCAVGPAADILRRAPQQKDRNRQHHNKRDNAEREKADPPAEGTDDRVAKRIAQHPGKP